MDNTRKLNECRDRQEDNNRVAEIWSIQKLHERQENTNIREKKGRPNGHSHTIGHHVRS